uniref:Uncharacterized protein n=1 Tax=Cannabis sativa TaxID=3483 RepID=A0A803QAW2_CANSA
MEHTFLYCNFASHMWRSSSWGIMPVVDSDYGSVLFSLPDAAIPHGWTPPPEEWIKINCDVKVGCDSVRSGLG